jgi:murein DD-endopeptidase MepM/ murein hydrolase activator NlpD
VNDQKLRLRMKRIRKLTTDTLEHPTNILRKIAIITVAVTTLSLSAMYVSTVHADSNQSNSLSTVYHVYINNKSMGTVDNKQVIEDIVSKKIATLKDTYKGLQLFPSNLIYVPEMVFHPVSNNQEAVKNTNSNLVINTNAFALQIDGTPVAYFKDDTTANDVINHLKLKYVPAKELNKLEARIRSSQDSLPPLEEGESRILEVKLDKNVSVIAGEIPPNQVLTVDQGVNLLQRGTLAEKKYTVKSGDVLGGIAAAYNLSLDDFMTLNPGLNENSLIDIGDKLNVTKYEPYVHVLVNQEVNMKENIPSKREVVQSNSMYKGDTKVKQKGQDGEKITNYVVSKANGKQIMRVVQNQKVTKEVVNEIVLKGAKVVPSRGTGHLAWPANGGYVSSGMGQRWGKFHKGIDIARPSNHTIMSADNGVIISAGWDGGGYGNKIVINHNNGYKTVYAHLSSISVNVGQTVSQGEKIGVMGATGDATGIHLHFEVYKNGSLENPMNYLE